MPVEGTKNIKVVTPEERPQETPPETPDVRAPYSAGHPEVSSSNYEQAVSASQVISQTVGVKQEVPLTDTEKMTIDNELGPLRFGIEMGKERYPGNIEMIQKYAVGCVEAMLKAFEKQAKRPA